MFKHSRRGAFGLLAIALSGVAFLAACGEEEVVDPYVYGTLDQVTRGHVQSEDFLFEIDAPEFVFVKGNTGLARSDNRLEVIVADDLENRAPSWDGKLVGVQKFFSPYVWLLVKRVKDPNTLVTTDLDSLDRDEFVLPHLTDVKLDEVSGFDIGTLRWNQKQKIDDMFEAEVQTVGTVHYLPDHQVEETEEVAAEGAESAASEPDEAEMAWYLKAESSDALFKITNVTPSLEFAFEILVAQDLPFVGGVRIGETYPYAERRESEVSAPIEALWVKYANRYLAP